MVLGIYKRVSTEEQSIKGLSLSNQESKGIELALKLGYDYKVYTDAGISGTLSFDKRKGLNDLLNDIGDKKINAVFVTDLDRLSRGGVVQTTLLKDIFKENNIRLFDINQEIDLNDINQDLLTDIKSLLAAFETKKTSIRIKQVLEKSAKEGKAGGGALMPFGYKKDENKKLVIHNEEAEIVKRIFLMALEGKGTKVIATTLNREGILTKRGRVNVGSSMTVRGEKKTEFLWRDAVVYFMLTNPMYKGQRRFRGNFYECPIIIEEEIFNIVQEAIKNRKQFTDTTNKYEYLLKGLIKCPVCKNKFYGHKRANGKDNAYVCGSTRYTGEFCGNNGISIDFLEEFVLKNIKEFDKVVDEAFKEVRGVGYKKGIDSKIKLFNEDIKENQKSIETLLDITQKAGINPTQFKSRFNKLNARINYLTKEVNLLKKRENILNEETAIKQVVKTGLSKFKTLSFEEKQIFVRSLISTIYVRWIPENLAHLITIDFRIDKLQGYLVSKELLINRTLGRSKRITKILDEKILIKKIYEDGTEDGFGVKYVD
jgi:DNA invertase Pin-like site-specific DNA recombinase